MISDTTASSLRDPIRLTVSVEHRLVTDGPTDRVTDTRRLIPPLASVARVETRSGNAGENRLEMETVNKQYLSRRVVDATWHAVFSSSLVFLVQIGFLRGGGGDRL